ncbi:hypothetical protein [Streptomyces sp. NPDC048516]|uniref:hypothetical protein n=1 Tax=Streptomyces sp. NPDC048516 TaxID=3365565 RepID=UPI00371054CD
MCHYAYGAGRPAHKEAVREHEVKPFHHEAAFLRCRPYGAQGTLDGQEPMAAAARAAQSP